MSVSAPDPTLDFLPLFPTEVEDVILQRWIDWANEGLDPVADADQWVDTREGGHWRTCVMPMVREVARLYDLAGTEVPASGFVLWAWEVYLDQLAAVYDVVRLAATPSLGTVTFTGPVGTVIAAGTTVSANPTTPDDPAPLFEVTTAGTIPGGGSIDLPVQAQETGSAGNVAAGAITIQSTPLPNITFTNAAPTIGGTDIETDDALRKRVLDAIAGKGPGTVLDYIRWAGGWPGVGHVSVVPVWNGASTVMVMVADPNGQPLPGALVAALQEDLDPTPGTGSGTAPVGAHVTVATSVVQNIDVTGHLTFLPGYSWDGAAGTVAVGPGIQAATIKYFLSVPPGSSVRLAHVAGIAATWPGVDNATAFQLNGAGADIALALGPPPKVAILHSYALV